jgi:2-hydroxy-3-keto-5-methylthiopentenyl-1-phosphate phosphatase
VASDFDQTLSFNDSGYVLSEMLGISDFQKKVEGLSRSNLVHQGAELAYLLRHDPEFRSVRREHLVEAGKRVRLKDDVKIFAEVLRGNLEGNSFRFFVISASPREVVQSALEGIVQAENVFVDFETLHFGCAAPDRRCAEAGAFESHRPTYRTEADQSRFARCRRP